MANAGKIIKDEIERISSRSSRKEAAQIRNELRPLRKRMARMRRDIQALQKSITALTKDTKRNKPAADSAEQSSASDGRRRFTARRIRALRKRLGLTQAELGVLTGVSLQAVNLWEHKTGRLTFRRKTLHNLNALKGMGKREAHRLLEINQSDSHKSPNADRAKRKSLRTGTTANTKSRKKTARRSRPARKRRAVNRSRKA